MTDWITSGTWSLDEGAKKRLECALNLIRGRKVLDIGARDGTLILTAARTYPEMEFHASDTNQSDLDWAMKKASELGIENVTFWNDDITNPKLPFEGYFDVVYILETLEHLPPNLVERAFNNARAFAKPDGRIVVSVPANTHISDPDHKTVFFREQFHGRLPGLKWIEDMPHIWLGFYIDGTAAQG